MSPSFSFEDIKKPYLEKPEAAQNKGLIGDVGTSLKKGALELPGMVTGLADVVPALMTGTRPFSAVTGFIGEKTGLQPTKWAKEAEGEYSKGLQAAKQEVSSAWEDPTKTGLDVAKAYITHPSYIASQVAESVPSMLAGGLVGRGLMGVGKGAQAAGLLEREVGKKTAAAVAGGVGEGVVQTGQAMGQYEGDDPQRAAIAAIGSGVIDAVIGTGAGRVAQGLGLETAETLMAKGFNKSVLNELSLGKGVAAQTKKVLGGAVSEGILQELPQSAQEAVWDNYANGRPIWEGVGRAAVEGALAGFVMGAGANVAPLQAQSTEDRVKAALLKRAIPEGDISVVDGKATVVTDTDLGGPAAVVATPDKVAEAMAMGDSLDTAAQKQRAEEEAPPTVQVKEKGAEFAVPPEEKPKGKKRIFESLPADEKFPGTVGFKIRGVDYRYSPPAGMSFEDMQKAIDKKMPSAAVNWLKKNKAVAQVVPAPGQAAAEQPVVTPAPGQAVAEQPVVTPAPGQAVAEQPQAIAAEQESLPNKLAQAVNKPDQVELLKSGGIVDETAQMKQIVRDAVTMKSDVAQAFRAKGKIAMAERFEKEAIEAGEKLRAVGDVATSAEVDAALQNIPQEVKDRYAAPSVSDIGTPQGTVADAANPTMLYASGDQQTQQPASIEDVEKKIKKFFGSDKSGIISSGRVEVVSSMSEAAKKYPKYSWPSNMSVLGVYLTGHKKIVIVADSVGKSKSSLEGLLRHEVAHALFREDPAFVRNKKKILDDFGKLAGSDQSVRDAFVRVPKNTPADKRLEEALAYWLMKDDNQKHSIFRRVLSAVKMALRRLKIPVTGLSTTEITGLFVQGTKAWSQMDQQAGQPTVETKYDSLAATLDDSLKTGKESITKVARSLSNPKDKLYNQYIKFAPRWLSVTPLNTMVQTFGKNISQIKDFANHLSGVVSAKEELVEDAAVNHDLVERLAKAGVGVKAFNRAAATASFNRMIPWKGIFEQDWVVADKTKSGKTRLQNAEDYWKSSGMRKATGKTFKEAYLESVEAYKALKDPELQDAYIKVTEHLQSIRLREKNNLLAYIESVSEEGTELREELMKNFDDTFKKLQGAYWPLARVGEYILEYKNAGGKRVVEQFLTPGERGVKKAVLEDQGISNFKEDFKDKRPKMSAAVPSMLMNQLKQHVEESNLKGVDPADEAAVQAAKNRAQDTVDGMNQIWLRWQPETSAFKNQIKRKNTLGFHDDMLRSYLDYVQKHASNIAWSEKGRELEADIDSLATDLSKARKRDPNVDITMERHILNDLRNRVHALRSAEVGPVASFLGKLSTAYYMTSPSIALVQMSQLGVLTYPKLATKYGVSKASKALASGVKEAFTKKFTRDAMFDDPVVGVVYDQLHEVVTPENRNRPEAEGKSLGERLYDPKDMLKRIDKLSPYQQQLLALREATARNLLDISAAHEAYELTKGKDPKGLRSKIFKLAMLPMSLSELTSRKATVLSTMKLAQDANKNFFEMMDDVADVVNETLFSYARENKGSALQGGIPRVILQFQHYRIMTGIRLATLFHDAIRGESPEVKKAATKEFMGIMGMTGMFAGTMGLPFAQTMFAIMSLILGDEDEPEDAELMFDNWIKEKFGQTAGEAITHGLPTLVGADISRRIGLADIYGFQNEAPTGMHGRNLAAWWAASQLGPVFSVAQSWVQGYDEMVNKGKFMKGLETATPKPIRDALKAYRVATEGLKTSQGKKLVDDSEIGVDEVILLALGFNADEVSRAQRAERRLRKMSTKISERRGELIRKAARAVLEGGDTTDIRMEIRKFNSKMPQFAVSGGDIRPAIRKVLKGEFGATGRRDRTVAEVFEIPIYMQK